MEKLNILKEFSHYLLNHKKFILIPIIIILLLFGILLITTQATPVAPFIYTIF